MSRYGVYVRAQVCACVWYENDTKKLDVEASFLAALLILTTEVYIPANF